MLNSFHPSAQQKTAPTMVLETDVEKRLQAVVARDRVRIREFFLDFDKLRKGWVGAAAVSIWLLGRGFCPGPLALRRRKE